MSFDPEQITFFAKTDARGASVPFGIKAKDRTRHVYVIGKTGMGKSTLLENMAIQDIKSGNGLAFIDPHGQTAETLLEYIPESRKDDVLYFAPFDTDNPVSFNVMEDVGPDKRHLVVSGLMSVFKKIFVDAWSARMEYILSNTILALLEYPDSTLLGVNRMLSDKVYRRKVIDNIKDPSVKSFWVDEFLNYNERYMQEAGDAIKNKIGQFTANPIIRNIIGQPKSSFDIREMMDKKKIIIMNLSKGLIGESNANLLGSMLTTRIYLAAMSRADMNPAEMKEAPNFYFYVDEFQSFANATFANILSEARKYKLNLTIAHQYIEQMEEEVRNAVFGNVGTTIAFRVGPFDAEVLETIFTPKFLAPDIVNLGFAQVYLTLMIDGIGSQPFSAVTLPPIKPAEISCREMVIDSSRRQFSKARPDVEKAIMQWHEVAPKTSDASKEQSVKTELKKPKSMESAATEAKRFDKPKSADGARREGGAISGVVPIVKTPPSVPTNHTQRTVDVTSKVVARSPVASVPQRTASVPEAKKMHPERTRNEVQKKVDVGVPKMQNEKTKNEKGLEDLRAILKKIAHPKEEEILESVPNAVSSAKESVGEHKPYSFMPKRVQEKEESPLKAKLAALVTEVVTKDERKDESPKARTDSVLVEAGRPVSHITPPAESVVAPLQTPVEDILGRTEMTDPLSPKRLERMMRVNGGDKSPLS